MHRAKVHMRVLRALPPDVLCSSYTEVERSTLTGTHTIRLCAVTIPRAMISTGAAVGVSIFAGFAFAALHASLQMQALPPTVFMQGSDTFQNLDSHTLVQNVQEQVQSLSPLERMRQSLDQRRQKRSELAAKREPVHAAAPARPVTRGRRS